MKDNHATSDGVLLVLTRKGGTDTTLTWAQAVEELLCYGWIDGQGGKRDETSYTIRVDGWLAASQARFHIGSPEALRQLLAELVPAPGTRLEAEAMGARRE